MAQLSELKSLLDPIRRLALQASAAIMDIYCTSFTVERKHDYSPVTKADMAAHHIIVDGLRQLTPGVPVLSEESHSVPYAERKAWSVYWLVDPLDGTHEFIKRNGEFTVNIALIVDGSPVLSAVCVPGQCICYGAYRGGGSSKQCAAGNAEPLVTRPWDGGHLVIAGSRSRGLEPFNRFVKQFESCEVLRIGSSLKTCYIAEGRADVYLRYGPTSEWDTAAAQCILENAGGALMDLEMQPLRYNTKDSLINPSFIAVGDTNHDWRRYLQV